jgi:hypothetical protein
VKDREPLELGYASALRAGGRCCEDVAVHSHDGGKTLMRNGRPYRYRHAFEWRRPSANVYTAAERRVFRIGLNRYPGVVIGVGVQVGRRVLSIRWGAPGRVIEL